MDTQPEAKPAGGMNPPNTEAPAAKEDSKTDNADTKDIITDPANSADQLNDEDMKDNKSEKSTKRQKTAAPEPIEPVRPRAVSGTRIRSHPTRRQQDSIRQNADGEVNLEPDKDIDKLLEEEKPKMKGKPTSLGPKAEEKPPSPVPGEEEAPRDAEG